MDVSYAGHGRFVVDDILDGDLDANIDTALAYVSMYDLAKTCIRRDVDYIEVGVALLGEGFSTMDAAESYGLLIARYPVLDEMPIPDGSNFLINEACASHDR